MADSESRGPAPGERPRTGSRLRTGAGAAIADRRVLGAVGALVAVIVVVWLLRSPTPDRPSREEVAGLVAKAVGSAVSDVKGDIASAPTRSALAFRRVLPSVVFITTDEATSARAKADGSPTSRVPGDPATGEESNGGLGAGVIINADGLILTANHVVSGAKVITVTFADGTSGTASILSAESERDIAVLRPDRKPEIVVPAVMGGGVDVGDEAYVIGHPLGLGDSMSAGVISGLGRSVPTEDGTVLKDLIQFDAAVNPGNSGGPLLNRNGQVVGIVTALANPSGRGSFVGIGFAVPIEDAGGSAGGPPK